MHYASDSNTFLNRQAAHDQILNDTVHKSIASINTRDFTIPAVASVAMMSPTT